MSNISSQVRYAKMGSDPGRCLRQETHTYVLAVGRAGAGLCPVTAGMPVSPILCHCVKYTSMLPNHMYSQRADPPPRLDAKENHRQRGFEHLGIVNTLHSLAAGPLLFPHTLRGFSLLWDSMHVPTRDPNSALARGQ